MEVRTDELKAVSRKGLGLFALFAAVCVAVALPNLVVNRVREADDVRGDVDRLCGTEAASAASATAALPFEHLHIAYTVAVENPDVHIPEFLEEFGPLRDGARIALAGIEKVTADLQMQYYVPSPVAETLSTLNLSDLHPESYVPPASPRLRVDTHLVVHVKGAPSAEDYANPTCYYQQGFGCVCLVAASGEGGGGGADAGAPKVAVDLAASERELERMLRVAYPPAMFEERGLRAAACGVLRSLSDTLLAIERLPLVQDVSDEASAAFELLERPGKEAAMRALKHALRASTHPQLITSTYFPPYHLVAVYLPIFFPIIVSVLIGCVQELKLTKQESRVRAASVTADTGK